MSTGSKDVRLIVGLCGDCSTSVCSDSSPSKGIFGLAKQSAAVYRDKERITDQHDRCPDERM
jgi:hypothetical protein